MPKHMLIATDLTARGDRPFERARLLAEAWDADRTLLFVNDSDQKADRAKVKKQLSRNYGDDVEQCNLVIEDALKTNDKTPRIIAETASKLDGDMIIAGAARHNDISDFFLGTAVDHLARHATMPILIVKERPRSHYKNILVASDFSDFSAHALKTALTLFPEVNIHMVHAYQVAFEAWLDSEGVADEMKAEAERELAEFMAGLDLTETDQERINTHLVEGNLHQSIHDMIENSDVDLLVLGTHGRGGFAMATIGSRASEMLGWSPVDVLLVRKPR